MREEVLYREALALGLDRDDIVIRRRLRQKMEFVSDEAAGLASPTDRSSPSTWPRIPTRFASSRTRGSRRSTWIRAGARKTLDADAKRLLDELERTGSAADPAKRSDSPLLEARYNDLPKADVAKLFGAAFADALFAQPTGRWVGPIASG